MNFKNRSNVGNLNFIQMNNYMISPGLNNNQNNINNLNNNQSIEELSQMNSGKNNN